jgi:hypothetical protein
MKRNHKKFVLEMLTGFLLAVALIAVAIASAIEIPFVYQGY